MVLDYKKTLNLPITGFSMRGNLADNEPRRLKNWYDVKLYQLIRSQKKGKDIFLIHDGPPYANGNIHIGHSINKILKDIIIKFKGLMGYDVPYIPGWDCHGLPIELKVEELISRLEEDNVSISQKDFRTMCRRYAVTQIKKQKKDFIRLGVIADWENSYSTMSFITEANIVRCLSRVISQGYLYRGIKPGYWCIECCSVLSEAEVDYNSSHVSPSIYVEFLSADSCRLGSKFGFLKFKNLISLIVWNTTPWTLPGNRALAVHPDYDYCLVKVDEKYYIFAKVLLKNVLSYINHSCYKIISSVKGKDLEFSLFKHPFMLYNVPIVLANYVLPTVGTGVVHIAPGHGIDDYEVAKKYNLEIVNLINADGFYNSDILLILKNLRVFNGNEVILSLLKESGKLLSYKELEHSYPYCWRHKAPVIFRITSQWFISLEHNNLRQNCLNKIDSMNWIPRNGKENIKSMILNRPDWCISRQRNWGVPIAVFLHQKTGSLHPRTVDIMEIVAKEIEKYGVQAWWNLDSQELIGKNDSMKYSKVYDVLDVWFDSGAAYFSSIASIHSEFKDYIPDMYLEGSDQYRGWFMSSLILSILIKGEIPCKSILVHGFSVDSQGRKMSKSIGNVISPQKIIDKFGADILRLWVASSDYSADITFSDHQLKNSAIAYRRIRNTARFILGNLNDFDPKRDIVNPDDMVLLDRWIISRALSVQSEIISDYKNYNFHKVVQRIVYFCSLELGSFYLDIIKDRQYVIKKESIARRSSQSALYHIIEAMVRWIAPVISFTADEIWRYIPGERLLYVFLEEWYGGLFCMNSSGVMNENYWNIFLQVRSEVNKVIEKERDNGYIRSSLEARIILYVKSELAELLNRLGNELRFGFLTSSVIVKDYYSVCQEERLYTQNSLEGLKIFLDKALGKKCHRCWHYTLDVGVSKHYPNICFRCVTNVFGNGEQRKFI